MFEKTAELRKRAVEMNIVGAETLDRKELTEALKNALTPSPEAPPKSIPEEGSGSDGAESEPAKERMPEGIIEEHYGIGSKAEIMKQKLLKQPVVKTYIPLEQGEKFGVTIPIQLNGYRINILKGVMVDVPQQIAEVIAESQKATMMAVEGNPRKLSEEQKNTGEFSR